MWFRKEKYMNNEDSFTKMIREMGKAGGQFFLDFKKLEDATEYDYDLSVAIGYHGSRLELSIRCVYDTYVKYKDTSNFTWSELTNNPKIEEEMIDHLKYMSIKLREQKTKDIIKIIKKANYFIEEKNNINIRVSGYTFDCITEKFYNSKIEDKGLGIKNFLKVLYDMI